MTHTLISRVIINPIHGTDVPAGTEVEVHRAPNPDYSKCISTEYDAFFTLTSNLKAIEE